MPVEFVHVDDAVRGALVNYTVPSPLLSKNCNCILLCVCVCFFFLPCIGDRPLQVVYAPFPVTQAQNVSAALRAYVQVNRKHNRDFFFLKNFCSLSRSMIK